MITTRAKFTCISETRSSYNAADGVRTYEFQAVYDDDVPEDQRYAKYTPSGSLKITVDNPNVQFELGHQYYLDFTPAAVPEASA
jgi:hypothetical protein